MKTYFKRFSALLLALMLVLAVSVPAFAEGGPTVTFKGKWDGFEITPGSTYTSTDLFGNFKNVMPGDTLTQNITFTNKSKDSDYIELYLRAVPHDLPDNPLSEGVEQFLKPDGTPTLPEDANEFLSQLTMRVYLLRTTLPMNSEKPPVTTKTLLFEGSPDQAGNLAQAVYLGAYEYNETAELCVELDIPIELDNTYAGRIGEVDWVFTAEGFNNEQLTVRKVWSDGYEAHAGDSIVVCLMCDGGLAHRVELSADNNWAYTFDQLEEFHTWEIEEIEAPEGYEVSYESDYNGMLITIVNTLIPQPEQPEQPEQPAPTGDPLDITVKKQWDDEGKNRPDSVSVTLYDGEQAVETVRLSAENDWTYTWQDPERLGSWQVLETSIPKGYTPSYTMQDGILVITNTATLIQTGMLTWPIFLLGGLGLLLVGAGIVLLTRKRRNDRA